MSLNVAFSFAFSALFVRLRWMPHGGLALANTLATGLEMVGLLVIMRRRLQGLDGRKILVATGQATLATLAMSLGIWAWLSQTSSQPVWLVALGGAALGAGIYGVVVLALGVKEARGLVGMLSRKVGGFLHGS